MLGLEKAEMKTENLAATKAVKILMAFQSVVMRDGWKVVMRVV